MNNNPSSNSRAVPPGGTDRELPKEVRYYVAGFTYRALTLKERWKLFLGCRLLVETYVACEQNPGKTNPMMKVHVTEERSMEKAVEKVKAAAAAEKDRAKHLEALKRTIEKGSKS